MDLMRDGRTGRTVRFQTFKTGVFALLQPAIQVLTGKALKKCVDTERHGNRWELQSLPYSPDWLSGLLATAGPHNVVAYVGLACTSPLRACHPASMP
jgi:hypothetical protein